MKRTHFIIGAVALVGVAACSPDATDFKKEGEDFIESSGFREELGTDVFTSEGNFTDAVCEEPENTDVGTRYICTATSPDGEALTIPIEITGKRELSVDAAGIAPAE